jgi:hypothetical protein
LANEAKATVTVSPPDAAADAAPLDAAVVDAALLDGVPEEGVLADGVLAVQAATTRMSTAPIAIPGLRCLIASIPLLEEPSHQRRI